MKDKIEYYIVLVFALFLLTFDMLYDKILLTMQNQIEWVCIVIALGVTYFLTGLAITRICRRIYMFFTK